MSTRFTQTYTEGLRVSHLLFWIHSHARELSRMIMEGHTLTSFDRDPGRLHAKHCTLLFPNGDHFSIITAPVGRNTFRMFHGDSFAGDFEVMIDAEDSDGDPLSHVSVKQLQALMNEHGSRTGSRERAPNPVIDGIPPMRLPATAYDPVLHGSFLYEDRHNFDSRFIENRVLVGYDRWHDLVSSSPSARDAVARVTAWCNDKCADEFAWSDAAPIWVFANPYDAFNFRLAWG